MAPEDKRIGESINTIEILLVEPSPGDTRLFTENFREAKLANSVHTVSDSEAALDFLHQREPYADEPRPDLVLLEPQLPGERGTAVLSELNDDPALVVIPVIVLTSSDEEEDIARSHGIDADHYLQKPVEPEEFVDFVHLVEDFWLALVHRSPED